MIPDPPGDRGTLAGGAGGAARDVSGGASRAGGQPCAIDGCDWTAHCRGLCRSHYDKARRAAKPSTPRAQLVPSELAPVVVCCPDDLLPRVAQLVENDARPIFIWLTLNILRAELDGYGWGDAAA